MKALSQDELAAVEEGFGLLLVCGPNVGLSGLVPYAISY